MDADAPFTLAIGGASEQQLAQVVTPSVTGLLAEVAFPVGCVSNMTVAVREVVDGLPAGVVLGSQVATPASVVTSEFRRIVFSAPVAVRAGTPYALVLSSSDSCGIAPGPVGDPYPGGHAFFDARPNTAGVWVAGLGPGGDRDDLPFRTFVEPTSSVELALDELSAAVVAVGPGRSLVAKVTAIRVALSANDLPRACAELGGLVREVRAQAGRHLTRAVAERLLAQAALVREALGCPGCDHARERHVRRGDR